MTLKRVNQFVSALLAAIFLALAVLPLSMAVKAQENSGGGGLRVPPGPIELEVFPGETKSFELDVRNITPNPLSVKVEVNDFESDGVTGDPVIIFNDKADENNPFSIRPYTEGPLLFDLGVDETKKLRYTITLPPDAAPGSRFGLLRFIANGGEGADEGVTLTASLGTIIIVNTPGDAVELVSFKDMKVVDQDGNAGSLFQSAPKQAQILLSNDGNTFVRPYGDVQVKNWSGDVVQSVEFNAGETRPGMLPQSSRQFEINLENIGGYGKYTVEANIAYGDGGNIIPATVSFWVIPWKLLLLALVVIVVIVIAINRGLKVYKRNVIKRSKTETHKAKPTAKRK